MQLLNSEMYTLPPIYV